MATSTDSRHSERTIESLTRSLRRTQILALVALAAAAGSFVYSARPLSSLVLAGDGYRTEIAAGRITIAQVGGDRDQRIYLGRGAASNSFALLLDRSVALRARRSDAWTAEILLGDLGGQTVQAKVQQGIPASLSVGGVDNDSRVSLERGEISFRAPRSGQEYVPWGKIGPDGVTFTRNGEQRARLDDNGLLSFHEGDVEGLLAAKHWRFLRGLYDRAEREVKR